VTALPCGKTHLHRQLRRSFAVRLHRAGALPVVDPDRVPQLCGIEAGQHCQPHSSAETAGIGWPEETHWRARAQAQIRRDIDRDDNGADQAGAGDVAFPFRPPEEHRQARRHRMDDRRLVYAVEFLAVDLMGVEHRRVHERQLFAAAEHRRLLRPADAGEHVEDLAAPRRLAAGNSDCQRIGDEGLGRGSGELGHPMFGHPFDMRDDLVDDGVLHGAAPAMKIRWD